MRFATLAIIAFACTPSRNDGNPQQHDARIGSPHGDAFVPDAAPPDAPPDALAMFCDALDIVLVIDNSQTMAAYQNNASQNAQALIGALDQTGLSYRVGITTASRNYTYYIATPFGPSMVSMHGDSGRILEMAACGMTSRWINYTDPARATKLACAVKQGSSGPSAQMPLGAMRDAFEARLADNSNTGFHRSDALLGVVLLTDQEDCSYVQSVTFMPGQTFCTDLMEPVDNYISFMDGFANGRAHWAASVIANTGTASCTSGLGVAKPATRLNVFATDVGANGSSSTICTSDLASGLTQAMTSFAAACTRGT